jgi:nucleoside-diphosphate-sugar epimerase
LTELPLEELASSSYVLVSFPPDGITDAVIAPMLSRAGALIYISSTAVYGDQEGAVDEDTSYRLSTDNHNRIAAEKIWQGVGATILRTPGFYDRYSGLHIRLKNGSYRLPGDGSNVSSRIHLHDLAQIILTAFVKAPKNKLYVVGDLSPAPQHEVVSWLCKRMSLPSPESAAMSALHYTHRANRFVVASKVLKELDIKLRYPSYKEGYGEFI